MNADLPIGGFLPLRWQSGTASAQSVLSAWISHATHVWLLHNGRSALHQLWLATKPRRVWLPAYICRAVASAVPHGIEICYFPLDSELEPRVDFLSTELDAGDHVLAVAYWGRPLGPHFASLVQERRDVGWVEDRAHTLWSDSPAWGDWVLYSPRKLVGAPDGGLLVARKKSLPPLETTRLVNFDFVLPALERFEDLEEAQNARWYDTYSRAEAAMSIGTEGISRLTLEVLRGSDLEVDAEARRSNYKVLHSRLQGCAFFENPRALFTPLGFPIRVRSAAKVGARLAKARIFAARHWETLPSDALLFRNEHQLAGELLTLPCDYRYGAREMHRLADALLAAVDSGD